MRRRRGRRAPVVDLPLLAPFLPEIGGALLGVALIVMAAILADKLAGSGGGGILSVLTAPLSIAKSLVHDGLNAAATSILSSQGGRLAHLLAGTADSIQHLIFYPARLFTGVHAALVYLWDHAIPTYVKAQLAPVSSAIDDLAGKLAGDVSSLRSSISSTLGRAEGYTDSAIASLRAELEQRISGAVSQADRYADDAVAKLRSAEDAAVAQATAIATTAEHDAAAAFDQAKQYADSLVAPVGGEVTALDAYIKKLDVPAIAAGATATAALVTALLADTGLVNEECRGKVKQICGTDPNVWANLLGLLAPLGLALSLRELVKVANSIGPGLAGVIREAG